MLAVGMALLAAIAPPDRAMAFQAQGDESATTVHAPVPLVREPVDESERVQLKGNVPPVARAEYDRGAVEDGLVLDRALVLLGRSPAQEEDLRSFLTELHTPGAADYHHWLKPTEFGRLFGPADSDVAAVTAWLEGHGIEVKRLHVGRTAIEIRATAGQMAEAFGAEIHRFERNGETFLANATEPSIPQALSQVVTGISGMTGKRAEADVQVVGRASYNTKTNQTTPQWSVENSSGLSLAVAPGDLAVEYDIAPVYSAGTTGAGQTIGVISASNIDLSLVASYRTLFGLPVSPVGVIVDGNDPGPTSSATEAYLDVEIAGSVAPGASILLYTAASTDTQDGLALAAMRAVDDDVAGVLSLSYNECEARLGAGGNQLYNSLWQQASAQGQTVVVAAGDSGSAGCDDPEQQTLAYGGYAVNGLASTPYDVAVGGTDFYYSDYAAASSVLTSQLESYWNLSPSTTPATSILQYIPEQVWNDAYGYNIDDQGVFKNLAASTILAGGGGPSQSAIYTGATPVGYAKPVWQNAGNVPPDGARDVPDVSLFSGNAANLSFYPICAQAGDCVSQTGLSTVTITGAGGTSAAAPAMAGIMALVDQSRNSWQGLANTVLYPIEERYPAAFHGVGTGTNAVPCYAGSANCSEARTGQTAYTYATNGFLAGSFYNRACGLGSLDAAQLIKDWPLVTFRPTTTTLNLSATTLPHGQTVTVTSAVAPQSGGGIPIGAVVLTANDGLAHEGGFDALSLSSATGSVSAAIDNLPGGTYQLVARYGGSNSFAASSSAPVTVTVAPEADTLVPSGYFLNPSDLVLYPLQSGITLPYGGEILLDEQVAGANETIAGQTSAATGSVTFTDNMTALPGQVSKGSISTSATVALNATGAAEWSPSFATGVHSVLAAYNGDASFAASAAVSAGTFTVIPGTTTLVVEPLVKSVAAGGSVTVDVQLSTEYLPLSGALPTGDVTVTLGQQTLKTTWLDWGATTSSYLEATVTFSNVPSGVLPVSASYAGDGNWLASAANGGSVIVFSQLLTPTVTVAANTATATAGSTVTLTATVAGAAGKAVPTGSVQFLMNDAASSATNGAGVALVPAPTTGAQTAGNALTATASVSLAGSQLANGNNIVYAVYSGNQTYNAGSSAGLDVQLAASDFSLTALSQGLPIGPGNSATSALAIAPLNGFSGPITLTSTSATGITVSCATATPTLPAGSTAAVSDVATVRVAGTVAFGVYPVVISATDGTHVHTVVLMVTVTVPDFSVSAPSTFTVAIGSQETATLTVNPVNGFSGPVTVSATAAAGITVTPTSATPTIAGATTDGLTISVASTVNAGAYPIAITVAGGSGSSAKTHSVTLTLTVPSGDFSMGLQSGSGSTAGNGSTAAILLGAGNSQGITLALAPIRGFNGAVTLSATAPAGITVTPSTVSPTIPANSTGITDAVTIAVASTVAAGTYTLTLSATGGGATHSVTLALTVPSADFSLGLAVGSAGSATTPLSILPGNQATTTLGLAPINGFDSTVTLSFSSGAAVGGIAVTPATVTPLVVAGAGSAAGGATDVLTVAVPATAAPGTYSLAVRAVGGGQSHSMTLSVLVPSPDFSMSATSAALNISSGTAAGDTLSLAPINDWNAAISLTASAAAGITVTPATASPKFSAAITDTFTISVANTVAPGSYPVTITGTGGGESHSITVNVTVATMDFTMTLASTQLVALAGGSSQVNLTLAPVSGFSSAVTLSARPPSGIHTSAAIPVPLVNVSVVDVVTIGINAGFPGGVYPIVITGTGGGKTHTATLDVDVPDFSLTAQQTTLSVASGGKAVVTLTLGAAYGFDGIVKLATSAPTGLTLSLANAAPVVGEAGATDGLTLAVASTVAPGNYSVVVTGSGSGQTHSVTIPVTVTASTFSLSVAAPTLTLLPGTATTSPLTLASVGAFSGAVQLSNSISPAVTGITAVPATPDPTVSSSVTDLVTYSIASSVQPGTYTLTITGVSGAQSQTTTVTIIVPTANFTLSLPGDELLVLVGSSASSILTLTPVNGFNAAVTLTSSAPDGITVTPTNASPTVPAAGTTGSVTDVLTFSAAPTLAPGLYTVTITGTGGGQTNSFNVTIAVPAPNFTLSDANPAMTIAPGSTGTTTLTLAPVNGFNAAVALTNASPVGFTVIPATGAPVVNTTLTDAVTIYTDDTVSPGIYQVILTGTGGGKTQTLTITVTVP